MAVIHRKTIVPLRSYGSYGMIKFGFRKEGLMKRLQRIIVLFIRKSIFYIGVSGRKILALLILNGIAFLSLCFGFWLHLVKGPSLLADIVVMSDKTLHEENYILAGFAYAIVPIFVVAAMCLIFYGVGIMLNWTDEDFFDDSVRNKKAAFIIRRK